MVEQGTGGTPVRDRFFLAAIALYILLTLALLAQVARLFGDQAPHAGVGGMATADWPFRGGW